VTGPRWFITGGGGQLATEFAQVLGGDVFLSREESLDIRDADAVLTAVRAFDPSAIVHTAAYTDVDGAETDPETARTVNVDGTRHVVAAARSVDIPVVFFSTDYVFDGEKRSPYVESDAPNPLGVYGRTKLEGEDAVLEWAHGVVIRTSWLFSATGRNFVKSIVGAAREREKDGEPLRVVDDQVGSPTFARHLAAAVDEALAMGIGPGIYHMAGSGYCSWYELACEVVQLAGFDVAVEPITTAELDRPAPRPAFSALGSERPVPRLPHWADGVEEVLEELVPPD
jgi:dTDP-4-dehydrorhamnose reductase